MPTDFRKALIGSKPPARVGWVVANERRMREAHEPAPRRRAPCSRQQVRVTGREPDHFGSGRQNMGRGLAACIQEILSGLPSLFEGDIYADLNGEQWQSHEWGCVRVRLGA
ncbi:hypothetical protein MVI01_55310 [Myxococcus virescens]|uniref:Uncharacterized protein n=2 Tax=Myxococcus virescens TaxID=83456 RepID=A0A511HJJ9_9BACT|nr:hypothetical protein MVI01_55310 [Myxococcus virescens]